MAKEQSFYGTPTISNSESRLSQAVMLKESNLTQSQFLIWMGQKLNPNIPLFNSIMTFTIEGDVNPEYFQAAFQTLVDRSDALRTVIEEVEGIPQQRVMPHVAYSADYLDFSRELNPELSYQTWLENRRVYQFGLAERLFDTALVKIAPKRHIWYLNQHHLITDSWSCSLIYRHVATFYEQLLNDQPIAGAEFPSFQDYVSYEHSFRNSPGFNSAEAYWKQKLGGAVELTRFYGSAVESKSTRTQRVLCDLGRERSQKLRSIAMEKQAQMLTLNLSLFNVFSTLIFSYLYRVSGTNRLTIGSPLHNRPTNALKETIGLCMEMGALQVNITKNETFSSLLAQTRPEILEVLRYSQHGIRNPVHNSAYAVIVNFHTASFPDFAGVPVQAEWLHSGHWDNNIELALQVQDFANSGSFHLLFDFNCDVFSEEQRQRAIKHFLQVVDAFIADREQPVNKINLLTEREKQRILVEFNQTTFQYPSDKTLVDLFEDQCARTPDSTAVVYEGRTLTYSELNRRANELAHYLTQRGIGPGNLVGVFLDRDVDLIIGLLGILKAGGAYVPLDPEYPAERLAFMLEDTQLRVLLTHERLASAIPHSYNSEVVFLDTQWAKIARESNENLTYKTTAQDLAYVIYTSGSTGNPKGVCCRHTGVVNLLADFDNRQPISVGDACSWWTSLNFDVSVYEIFSPLTKGGALHIIPETVRANPVECIGWLQKKRINSAYLPPFMLADYEAWLQQSTEVRHLRRLLVGVEPIHEQLLIAINQSIPDLHIINGYGPTEATICCTLYSIDPTQSQERTTPIGKPARNTNVYLLDEYLQPVPIGIPGELYVGGVGLAQGYLNRPELTTEKFIDNPFNPHQGAKLYKTGDLAYYLPDGNIMFVGRTDHQVKIRGFRVELGEIESVLRQHPAVGQAVVILRQMENGKERLEAYVVAHLGRETPTVTNLNKILREKLPGYMIPQIVVVLDALPVTPNGKVDREALLAHSQPDPEKEVFVAPRTPVEKNLVEIWSQVLDVERVSVHDNFFHLGGDSISTIGVMMQISQTYQIEWPSAVLFEMPTISELASRIEESLIAEIENLSDEEAELLLASLE
jgi:amino acid adenylation domain-containing protein